MATAPVEISTIHWIYLAMVTLNIALSIILNGVNIMDSKKDKVLNVGIKIKYSNRIITLVNLWCLIEWCVLTYLVKS